jgi:hypothetical protein
MWDILEIKEVINDREEIEKLIYDIELTSIRSNYTTDEVKQRMIDAIHPLSRKITNSHEAIR